MRNRFVRWERGGKRCLCNVGEGVKDVYVTWERGYLSRTSRPRNAFSPPHPLRLKTGNAFLSQTYKSADYQQFI
nr:MAG TPA: hypothetical protein [Caudoviricetes sp.]